MSEGTGCALCGAVEPLFEGVCAPCIDRRAIELAHRRRHATNARLAAQGDLSTAIAARVVAQPEAQRAIEAILRERSLPARGERAPRVLLVGPPGSGKSTLGRALCELWPGPSLHASAGRIAAAGDLGESVEQLALELVRSAGPDPIGAERGALFVDGIEAGDERFASVQRELLRLLEGGRCEPEDFRGREAPGPALETKGIAILVAVTGSAPDLLDAFRARFDRVLALSALGEDELARVLDRSLVTAGALLAADGVTLDVSAPARLVLARAAAAAGEGGWAIARLARRLFEEALLAGGRVAIDDKRARALAEAPS